MPAPPHVSSKPFFQMVSAIAWTTLTLTIKANKFFNEQAQQRQPVPAIKSSTTTRQASSRNPGRSTSRTGTGARTAETPRGATRTRRLS